MASSPTSPTELSPLVMEYNSGGYAQGYSKLLPIHSPILNYMLVLSLLKAIFEIQVAKKAWIFYLTFQGGWGGSCFSNIDYV